MELSSSLIAKGTPGPTANAPLTPYGCSCSTLESSLITARTRTLQKEFGVPRRCAPLGAPVPPVPFGPLRITVAGISRCSNSPVFHRDHPPNLSGWPRLPAVSQPVIATRGGYRRLAGRRRGQLVLDRRGRLVTDDCPSQPLPKTHWSRSTHPSPASSHLLARLDGRANYGPF